MSGTLYVVATPIGNLEDLTFRAKRILSEVDMIVCEDTRVTSRLLAAYDIRKTLRSLHEHTTPAQMAALIRELIGGKSVAYVSDAGTPGVNDPGGKMVEAAYEAGIRVEPIPGVSALTAAISVCGFAMDDFTYLGFVPHKKGRQTFFKLVAERTDPSVFFESTHRMLKTIEELEKSLAPNRMVYVGRELTKMHETSYRGTVAEIHQALDATSWKGEFVIIIGPERKALPKA